MPSEFVTETLSLSWLNKVLQAERQSAIITSMNVKDIGAGVGFGGEVYRISMEYDQQSAAPDSVILKLPVDHQQTLETMQITRTFDREVKFYRDLASPFDNTPVVYHITVEQDFFAILMEDLGGMVRERPYLSETQLIASLKAIGQVHATYWNNPICKEEWLQPVSGEESESARSALLGHVDAATRLITQSEVATDSLRKIANRLQNSLPKRPKTMPEASPFTLTHGDFHGDNVTFGSARTVIFDWQLVAMGSPLDDVANMIGSSADPALFASRKEAWLRQYHQTLIELGVRDYPLKKLRRDFTLAMFMFFLKSLVVLGLVDQDGEQGRTYREDRIRQLNQLAVLARAELFSFMLPAVFVALRLLNSFSRQR